MAQLSFGKIRDAINVVRNEIRSVEVPEEDVPFKQAKLNFLDDLERQVTEECEPDGSGQPTLEISLSRRR